MSICEKFSVVQYIPAELHENKECYISYYVINPQTKKLHLKRIKLNRVKNKADRRKWGRQLVHEINIKLASGWNPFIEQEASKSYHKLIEVLDTFILTKEKELRPDSMRSYRSFIKLFKEYIITTIKDKNMYVISFDKNYAINFLQDIYLKNKISERSYNNHLTFYRSLFNWLIQYNYSKVNPFENIAKKKEKQKTRILIDHKTKDILSKYLKENNYEYFVMCMMAHYALLRPKEITYLKIKDINPDYALEKIKGVFI